MHWPKTVPSDLSILMEEVLSVLSVEPADIWLHVVEYM